MLFRGPEPFLLLSFTMLLLYPEILAVLLIEYLRSQAEVNSPKKHFGIVSSDADGSRLTMDSSKDMPLKEFVLLRCTTAHQLLRYLGEHHRNGAKGFR